MFFVLLTINFTHQGQFKQGHRSIGRKEGKEGGGGGGARRGRELEGEGRYIGVD